jgi:hypothetical protein
MLGFDSLKRAITDAGKGLTPMVSKEVTRPTGALSYTANTVIANATNSINEMQNVVRENGGSGYITGIKISTNKKSITPRIRLHLYNANNPTLAADNVTYKELYADTDKRLGFIDLPTMTTADATNGDMSRTVDFTQRIPFQCAAATTSLWFVIETIDAFSADSSQKFTVKFNVEQN